MSEARTYFNKIGYTDTTPFEAIRQVSAKCFEIRMMEAVVDPAFKPEFVMGGFAAHCTNQEEQKWIITSNDRFPTILVRLQKNGQWKDTGGNVYRVEEKPVKFHDYNF